MRTRQFAHTLRSPRPAPRFLAPKRSAILEARYDPCPLPCCPAQETRRSWLPLRATGRPRWRATTPTLPWPTATKTPCARRFCATWPRPRASTPLYGKVASRSLADPSPSTPADPVVRPTRWPTAPAACAWPCADSRSKRAATSPVTVNNSKPSATKARSPSSSTSSRTKGTIIASWARSSAATTPPPAARPKLRPKPCSKRCWPSAVRDASSPARGSATPSTASMTDWAPSSASCRVCRELPPATRSTCFSPASPA